MPRAITVLALLALLVPGSHAAAQQARLIVTVVDYSNVAVADAKVQVFRIEPDQRRTLYASEETSDSGIVVIEVDPLEEYQLQVLRSGFNFYGPVRAHPPAGDIGFLIRLQRMEWNPAPIPSGQRVRYGLLTGRVVSAIGTPMANQGVLVRSITNPGSMFSATTGPDGRYHVEVPPDRYSVRSGDTGMVAPHGSQHVSIRELHDAVESPPVVVGSGAEVVVNLALPRVAFLYNATITVVDEAGQPAKDTEVEVFWRRDPPTPNLVPSSFLGLFHTDGEPVDLRPTLPGPITVVARSLSGATPLAGITPFDLQAASRQIRVVMHPAARVSGRVEFAGRETPLQGGDGIRVIFQPVGSSLNFNSIATRIIAPDGTFTLNGLIGEGCLRIYGLPARWRLQGISREGVDLTDRLFTLEPGDARSDVVVRVEPGEPPPAWEPRPCT